MQSTRMSHFGLLLTSLAELRSISPAARAISSRSTVFVTSVFAYVTRENFWYFSELSAN